MQFSRPTEDKLRYNTVQPNFFRKGKVFFRKADEANNF